MRGTFEYKLDGSGDAINLNIDLDAVSANALVRLDRYINWGDVLKLTENDPEAAYGFAAHGQVKRCKAILCGFICEPPEKEPGPRVLRSFFNFCPVRSDAWLPAECICRWCLGHGECEGKHALRAG